MRCSQRLLVHLTVALAQGYFHMYDGLQFVKAVLFGPLCPLPKQGKTPSPQTHCLVENRQKIRM